MPLYRLKIRKIKSNVQQQQIIKGVAKGVLGLIDYNFFNSTLFLEFICLNGRIGIYLSSNQELDKSRPT